MLTRREQKRRCSLCHRLLGPTEGQMSLLPGVIGKARGGGSWRMICVDTAACQQRVKVNPG